MSSFPKLADTQGAARYQLPSAATLRLMATWLERQTEQATDGRVPISTGMAACLAELLRWLAARGGTAAPQPAA